MKININSFVKKSIYFLCIYMIYINYLCSLFHLPIIIRYIPDLFIPILLVYLCLNYKKLIINRKTKRLLYIVLLLFFHCLVGFLLNYKSVYYFLWGFRNVFRFFIVSLSAIISFSEDDKEKYIKLINISFIINIIVCLIQYYFLGYWGDSIGGTFRLGATGGNGGLLYLIIIENSIIINKYLEKNIKLFRVVLVLFFSIFIAIIAELKVLYFLLIFIIVLSILLNKFSIKKLIIIIFSIVIFIIGYNMLDKIDHNTVKMMNINSLLEYAGGENHGYSSENDISRLRAFNQINEYFFENNIFYKVWGYGLGNCDISSIDIFYTDFAKKYDTVLHYTWFTHAMLYIETGLFGYLLYISYFIYIILICFKTRKIKNTLYNNSIIIIGLLSIIMTLYNSVLRNDCSFFVYLFLIMPFIIDKQKTQIII